MRVWRVWRAWIVPVGLLLVAGGCASPIALMGSVQPAVVAAPTAPPAPVVPDEPIVPVAPAAPVASGKAGPLPHWMGEDLPTPLPARRIDCERVRCVALTFDDGPGAYTGALLDLLAARHVRATFFVVGRMVSGGGEGLLRRMVAQGHELGNHTWDHPELTLLREGEIRAELGRTQWLVKRATGVTMTLMRPPYGLTDPRVAAESRHLGLAQILWNVDTLDWRDRDMSVVADRANEAGPGSVVLLHDIHPSTVQAVPRLLDELAARGYRFVTLSELYGGRPAPGRRYYGDP